MRGPAFYTDFPPKRQPRAFLRPAVSSIIPLIVRLPVIDHARYERALRMASAAREAHEAVDRSGQPLLTDRFGRRITYLRLSVTDRCNLKCEYCVPATEDRWLPKPDILLDDEIVEILSTMAASGLE